MIDLDMVGWPPGRHHVIDWLGKLSFIIVVSSPNPLEVDAQDVLWDKIFDEIWLHDLKEEINNTVRRKSVGDAIEEPLID